MITMFIYKMYRPSWGEKSKTANRARMGLTLNTFYLSYFIIIVNITIIFINIIEYCSFNNLSFVLNILSNSYI